MYLLDTDTIIYSLKGNTKVIEKLTQYSSQPKALSVITYGELVFGARKSKYLEENLAKVYRLKELFPIFEMTTQVMDLFGEMKAELQKKGQNIADFDLLIGATALLHGYTVVTNNTKHFKKIKGLKIDNWSK